MIIHMTGMVHDAVAFAARAHAFVRQVRKYTGEPYIVHPIDVMMKVTEAVQYDEHMLAAAVLHDVVEDTKVKLWEVEANFGVHVSTLVHELTEPEWEGNRAARKLLERERLATISPAAQTVKLADLISNSNSIVALDHDFAKVYLREKAAILQVMKQGDQGLWQRAWEIIPDRYKETDDDPA